MTTFEAVFVGAGYAIFTLGLLRLPKAWRGEAQNLPDDPYPGWPFGVPAWRAFIRLPPVSLAALWFAGIAVLIDETLPDDEPIVVAILVVTTTVAVVSIGLGVWIVLYNRPKWLVMPHYRDDPGLLDKKRGFQTTQTSRRPSPVTRDREDDDSGKQ